MSDVIDFKPGAEITPRPNQNKKRCKHMRVIVVEASRMLECEICGGVVDPFDFLWAWANRRLSFARTEQHYSELIKKAKTRLTDLERLEKNAKARLRRALEKPPTGKER